MRRILLITIAAFTHYCVVAATTSHPPEDTLITHVRQMAQDVFESQNYPGMALAVWHKGKLRWSEGFGYADIDNKVKIDPAKSLFRIGSVSKSLTGVGLMKLHEQGKVDLDAAIQEYVSEFPEKRYPLTLRQVAQHVGGIRHYRGIEFMSNLQFATVRDGLEIFMHDTLLFEPGTQYAYSSYGWNLVSAAMETAADQEFLSYMQDKVFKPLKMKHTVPDDNTVDYEHRVTFYVQQDSQNIVAPTVDNSYKWAGGGFLSTAEDLIRFGEAILVKGFLSEGSLDISWTGYTLKDSTETKYGIGWYWDDDGEGRRWVGHGGGSVGGSSMFLTYPEEELIVVMLVNLSQARSEGLPFRIADAFLAQE